MVVFDGHVKHVEVSAETAPTMPNELARHTGPPRHGALAPTVDENKPGLHTVHCALAADVEPKGPTLPTAQGTPEQRGAAAADHVPETHIVQEFEVVSMVPLGPEKPAAHMQVAAPVVFVNELAGQALHVAAAADEAPSGPDELNAQGVPTQPSDAVALAKVPEGHAVHAAAALELAPAIEKVPTAQTVPLGAVLPATVVNWPGSVVVQVARAAVVAPAVPKDPGGQMVPTHAVAPTDEYVPGGQIVHVVLVALARPVALK